MIMFDDDDMARIEAAKVVVTALAARIGEHNTPSWLDDDERAAYETALRLLERLLQTERLTDK